MSQAVAELLAVPPLLPGGVRFVRSHDTVENEHVGGIGMAYSGAFDVGSEGRKRLTLAWAYLLALEGGTCLIYKDDAEFEVVQYGVKFRRLMTHAPTHFIFFPHGLVAIVRGCDGFVLLNVSNGWVRHHELQFLHTRVEGRYFDLQYGCSVVVDASQHVVEWGGSTGVGVDIGPLTALFFVAEHVPHVASKQVEQSNILAPSTCDDDPLSQSVETHSQFNQTGRPGGPSSQSDEPALCSNTVGQVKFALRPATLSCHDVQRSQPAVSQRRVDETPRRLAPLTIYHAFQEPFSDIRKKLHTLALIGYDAVLLSPAQVSAEGSEWWRRYQPASYRRLEGLGSEADLKVLCGAARDYSIVVLADVVFHHARSCATPDEWWDARADSAKLEMLLARLDRVCENLNREHYWPWNEMVGDEWDNENRTTYWAFGTLPTFRPDPVVLREHMYHLDQLLTCGVRGFRFDAAKHLEISTLRYYIEHVRRDDRLGIYIMLEVLSGDPHMQNVYSPLGPTTDFRLAYHIHSAFSSI